MVWRVYLRYSENGVLSKVDTCTDAMTTAASFLRITEVFALRIASGEIEILIRIESR